MVILNVVNDFFNFIGDCILFIGVLGAILTGGFSKGRGKM